MVKNGLYNVFGSVVKLGIGILIVPLLVRTLGLSEYGLWILVSTSITIVELAELGLSVSTTYFVAQGLSANDYVGVQESLTVVFGVVLAMATFALIGLWFGADIALTFFPTLTESQRISAHQALQIGAFVVWVQMLQRVFIGIQQAYRNYGVLNLFTSIQVVVVSVGMLVVALTQGTTVALMSWNLVASLFSLFVLGILSLRCLRPNVKIAPVWRWERALRIMKYSMSTWAVSLSTAMFSRVDRLVIGSILGVTGLGIYGSITQMAAKINTFSGAVVQPLLPELSYSAAKHREAPMSLLTLARQAFQMNAATALGMSGSLSVVAPIVVYVVFPADAPAFMVPAFSLAMSIYGLYSLNAVAYFTHFGLRKLKHLLVVQLLGSFLALSAIMIGAQLFGVVGAIAGNAMYISTLLLNVFALKWLGVQWRTWFSWIAFPLVWFLGMLVAALLLPEAAMIPRLLVAFVGCVLLGFWMIMANPMGFRTLFRKSSISPRSSDPEVTDSL